jgi:ribosomal protein S18 acetylase RimI-like enzyme
VTIVRLSPALETQFAIFLRDLKKNGDEAFFSPHPFTDEEARRLAHYEGKDYYCVAVDGGRILGYGMLRGWDEGHSRPSLGIAVHPELRRNHRAEQIMEHLHEHARSRWSREVRLRVRKDNAAAIKLYEKFGYRLSPDRDPLFYEGILAL